MWHLITTRITTCIAPTDGLPSFLFTLLFVMTIKIALLVLSNQSKVPLILLSNNFLVIEAIKKFKQNGTQCPWRATVAIDSSA